MFTLAHELAHIWLGQSALADASPSATHNVEVWCNWNPVKHGVVDRVEDYPWSSFQRHVRLGEYEFGWGRVDPCPDADERFEAWSTEEEKPRRLDRDRPRQGRK